MVLVDFECPLGGWKETAPWATAWVLIPPLVNHNQQFFLSPQALKISPSPQRQTKALIILILSTCLTITPILISKQPTHMLILWWCHVRELFGSQIPVTTGGFELWISCIRRSYLTHKAIRSNRLGGFRVPEWKIIVVQTLLLSLEVVNQIILKHDTIAVWN